MRVLLATDGSASADKARDLVASLRWPSETVVRIVAAVEAGLEVAAAPFATVPGGLLNELDAELARHADVTLDAAERMLGDAGLRTERMVLAGRAADEIVKEARAWPADLVVLGNRGHGTIATMLLGSTSAEVVDHAPCPVLVVRDGSIASIVLASDGSEPAAEAERLLVGWPMFRHLPATVVSVAVTGHPLDPGLAAGLSEAVMTSWGQDIDAARHEVAEMAERVAGRLRAGGMSASARAREGDPAGEIVTVARSLERPLIVMGTRGHTGMARLLLGGVARNVLYHAPGSVLVVRQGIHVDLTAFAAAAPEPEALARR